MIAETAPSPRKTHLGWLGPVIIVVGAAVAILGVWYMVSARPRPGDVIQTIKIDDTISIVVRAEQGGDRNFVELHDGAELRWQAYVPHYAGRVDAPGIAYSPKAVSVRVMREGRAEIFAISTTDAQKLGGLGLAPQHPRPVYEQKTGPVTLDDHVRSYEFVEGPGWHQLVSIDLQTGKGLWNVELGADPVQSGTLVHLGATDVVRVVTAKATRDFDVRTGTPVSGPAAASPNL